MQESPSTLAGVQEIEVKYRVARLEPLLDALALRGVVLSDPITQDDQAYAPAHWDYGQSKVGVPFARLRTEAGRHLFTVKVPVDNEMACREHESLVADRDQMHQALLAMGFRPTIRIVKTRRTGVLDGLSLCVDDVQHAGGFLEVEQLVPITESGLATQRRLDEFVMSLGVPVQRTTDTYDSLIRAQLLGV
ncbi:class IV adenylate cyclase [Allorhizocola rhizosphaerae]|uniref:class IV adenylate cyclase n=1 Tax=Allorhizocola rhizosphaerae TaxID=1872709 RepID=UPI000E3CC230|nr:CYTH domain-containing protein [Allorhizocola rhizosphaerae]